MYKKAIAVASILCVLLSFGTNLFAQDTADLFIENKSVSGGYFYFEIHITPTNDWGTLNRKALGNSSWYFSYNAAALSNPVLTYESATYVGSGDGYTNSTGITGGRVQVTTDLSGGSDGYNIPTSQKTHIYTVRMDITDSDASSSLLWDEINTGIYNAQGEPITESYNGSGDISLPVQMSSIEAQTTNEGVAIIWATRSEVDNMGFNIWRSETSDGKYVRITSQLISGQGNNSQGAEYSYIDESAGSGSYYWYKIEEISTTGEIAFFGPISVMSDFIPDEFALAQNYPNPFNPVTKIVYDVPEQSDVTIRIFSLLGKQVKIIFNEKQSPGRFELAWDGTDDVGRKLASGVYFLRMDAGAFTQMRKMTIIR